METDENHVSDSNTHCNKKIQPGPRLPSCLHRCVRNKSLINSSLRCRLSPAGLGVKDHDPTKLEPPSSPSRAELYQQQVLSERARVQGRRSSLFLSVEGAGSENQAPPLLTQSHSMDDLGELPPPAPVLSPSPTPHTFLHPLTGKPLGGCWQAPPPFGRRATL